MMQGKEKRIKIFNMRSPVINYDAKLKCSIEAWDDETLNYSCVYIHKLS